MKTSAPLSPATEDGGAGGTTCADDEHLCSLEGEAAFERLDDAGDVSVEAVELAVLGAEDGVDRADLGGERVGALEQRHDILLERHGNAHALDGDFPGELEEVVGLGRL